MGDVHGCVDELEELLQRFSPVDGDRLVAVGDLVNKGPDSAGVVDLVRAAGIRCVQGNHEAKLLRVQAIPEDLRGPRDRKFAERIGPRLEEIAAEVARWPLWLDLGDLLVVHAGLEPGVERLDDMRRDILLTIRTWDGSGQDLDSASDPPWFDCVRWPVPVVFGHWAMRGLVDRPDVKGLDTGCVYGRWLTGWCPQEERFYHVQARMEYAPLARD
ncbi:MAG TPA: metallophosphoesterase [Fibrobacteria bacterium]|nr:metallophosphoesterase [Fibrobacteria bacterium]